MRILVIKNSKHKNSYTTCIHILMEEIGRRNNYQILFTDSFKECSDASNSINFIVLPPASSIKRLLQQQRLRSYILKNKIDLLIQNASFLIKQKIIPQLLIADDINQLHPIKKISFSEIILLTYSQTSKQTITDRGFTNIVHAVPYFADILYQPINWSMQQQVKIDYTEGREYFY